MKALAAILLLVLPVQSCLSEKQKDLVKEHSIEMGSGIAAGAALVGLGPAGPFVALALTIFGIGAAEGAKPPPPQAQVIIIHERVDADGKVTTKVETTKPKEGGHMPDTGLFSWLPEFWKWIVGGLVAFYLFTHPKAIEAMIASGKLAWGAVQRVLHPVETRKRRQ